MARLSFFLWESLPMSQFLKTLLCTAALATMAMVGSANAALLGAGSVSMAGGWVPVGGDGTIGLATGVHFIPPTNNVMVTFPGGTGSFASLTAGTVGTAKDFNFNPSNTPISNFLQLGGFFFTLASVHVDAQTASFLDITGIADVASNAGTGTATFDFSSQGGGTPATFSWSATAFAVPEPMTLGVLGIGLAAFGLMRRRRPQV
jgi:hypothetical protein